MNPDPFENLIQTSQRGTPNVQTKSQSSEDPFQTLIHQPTEEISPKKKKYNDFSWYEKHFTSEGQEAQASKNRNFLKAILSGASAEWSEYFDPLKVDYDEADSNTGYFAGAMLPIGLTYKGIGLGFNVLKNLYSFGPKALTALEILHQGATGLTYGATKELGNVAKGQEFDPYVPIMEGAEFAALGALMHGFIKYAPKVQNWLKSLNPSQAEEFLQGVLPENLTPNQYKFWQDEVAPEWLKSSEKTYTEAVAKANQEADFKFKQDQSIAKANHEKEMYEARLANDLTQEKYEISVQEYENNLQKAKDEYEAKINQIQTENEQMAREFEDAQQSYHQMRARESAVENSTRLRPGEEELPYRPAPDNLENPSSTNEVGNIISKNEAVNSTNMGRSNIEAVRANDAADYRVVNDAYKLSDELSANVTDIHMNLVNQLETSARELRQIAHLSAPQRQHLQAIEDILARLRSVGANGEITGFLEVDNHFLHEQAKSLRYVMDFTFEHGNTKGIFGRTVGQLEEAAEVAARATGNDAAADANIEARRLYRAWSQDYNNDYIRPYRDTRNQDYSGLFKQASSSTDEFNALDHILSRSNAGQQLSSTTKRALVENKLGKFLENPHQANGREFELALRELSSVISPEEISEIRQVFHRARNLPEPVKKPPKPPSFKEIPESNLPEFKGEPPKKKEITTAKIAHREFVETPEVKIAAKEMKKTVSEIRNLADSPEGIHKLKENISKDVFKKIGQQRLREILYKGEINPKKVSGNSIAQTLNTGNNFEIVAEFIGENEAMEMLEAAQALRDSPFTKENLLKYGKKMAGLKALMLFGIF